MKSSSGHLQRFRVFEAQLRHFEPREVHLEDFEQPLEVLLLARDVSVGPVPNELVLLVLVEPQLLLEVQAPVSRRLLLDCDEVHRLEVVRLLEALHGRVAALDEVLVDAVQLGVDELLDRELELLEVPVVDVGPWSAHRPACAPP